MANTLPISRLIDVSVVLTSIAAQAQDLSTLLILGDSAVIDVDERLRTYINIANVATDFSTSADEYLAALLWFEQAPQPTQLKIGRWAQTDTAGVLVGAPLSAAEQLVSAWIGVANGGFSVTIDDAGGPVIIGPIDFSSASNMNGVASLINTALVGQGATCVWNANYSRFELTSATTGADSAVSFLIAPGSGTDISGQMLCQSTDDGAYVADGIVAESAADAAALFDAQFGQTWYGLVMPTAEVDDHLTVAAYIEAATNKHLYGVTTQDTTVLTTGTSDIAYLLSQLNYSRTLVQYSSANEFAVCSLFGRALTVDYNGQNTVITLMYKQEPGITAENLTPTQIDNLEAKDCNVFVAYNNSTAIVEQGKVCSGDFIDEITGTDWLAVSIMTALYSLLYTSTTKIPQTDAGEHLLVTTIESVCSQAVINGLLAPGVWNSGGFGTLKQGAFIPKGFYVYAPPVANQLQADREARRSVAIQVAAKLAGAVHTVDVSINVNR